VNWWKVILATLVIYLAGIGTGALVVKSARRAVGKDLQPPPPWLFQGPDFIQQRFLDRMKKELELSAAQAGRIEAILRDSRERMKSWWEIVGPEMKSELKETEDKIRAELQPRQREKFELLRKDRHRPQGGPGGGERWSRDGRRGGRPPPQGTNGAARTNPVPPAPGPLPPPER
jgi:hypothetical protein